MAGLSEYQTARCLHVLDSLQSYRISTVFARPVDPDRDHCPTYRQIIREPMDLGTVRKKLLAGQYHTIRQWKDDVDLIWANAIKYHGTGKPIASSAKQLQHFFRDLTKTFTDATVEDWVTRLDALKGEVDRLGEMAPEPAVRHTVQPKPPPVAEPETRPVAQKHPPQRSAQRLTTAEIDQIADDVNGIDDPDHITMVIDLIRKEEPHLATDDGELEIEVKKLRQGTLLALRALVSQIRN
jgi:hypothetical protein